MQLIPLSCYAGENPNPTGSTTRVSVLNFYLYHHWLVLSSFLMFARIARLRFLATLLLTFPSLAAARDDSLCTSSPTAL
jgi:hypothetical protein